MFGFSLPFPKDHGGNNVLDDVSDQSELRALTNQASHPRHRNFCYPWRKVTAKPNIGPKKWNSQ